MRYSMDHLIGKCLPAEAKYASERQFAVFINRNMKRSLLYFLLHSWKLLGCCEITVPVLGCKRMYAGTADLL